MHHATLIAAFLMGLLGSSHCVMMCGAMASLSQIRKKPEAARKSYHPLLLALIQNIARVLSYTCAGALVGTLASFALIATLAPAQRFLQAMLAVLLIGAGLYIAGLFPRFAILERLGAPLWKKVEPLARKLMPIDSPSKALRFGFLWGWLPCGLVYSALALAMTAGSAIAGGLTMAAFGLGTLPMLIGIASAAQGIRTWLRAPAFQKVAGSAMVIFGMLQIVSISAHGHLYSHSKLATSPPNFSNTHHVENEGSSHSVNHLAHHH